MIEIAIAFGLGVAVGAWGYRYSLKKRPDAVERIAAEIKAKGDEYL